MKKNFLIISFFLLTWFSIQGVFSNIEVIEAQSPPEQFSTDDAGPDIELLGSILSMGVARIGDAVIFSFPVSNAGGAPLLLEDIRVPGPAFSVYPNSLTIPPGQKLAIDITFSPKSTDWFRDTLRIISNDPDESDLAIKLSGRGVVNKGVVQPMDAAHVKEAASDGVRLSWNPLPGT